MYQGIIKVRPTKTKNPYRFKIQMLQKENVENNGAIIEQLVMKTVEFKTDYKIKVSDFNIVNLQSIGTLSKLKPTQLNKSIETIEKEANTANNVMEQLEFIKEIESYGNENQVQTESN